MTTVDTPGFIETVLQRKEAVDARAATIRPAIQWRRLALALLTALPLLAGMAVGFVVTLGTYVVAAFLEGYEIERGRVRGGSP